jgi:hypothetical protein
MLASTQMMSPAAVQNLISLPKVQKKKKKKKKNLSDAFYYPLEGGILEPTMEHRPYPVGVEIDPRSQSWLSFVVCNGYVLVFSGRRPSCNGCSTRVENYSQDARSRENFVVSKGVPSPEQSGLHSVRSATTNCGRLGTQTAVVQDSEFYRPPLSRLRRLLKGRTHRLLGGIRP